MAKPKAAKPKKRAKPRKSKAALNPATALTDPQQTSTTITLIPARTAGVRVNEETAMSLGAVWACVRVISESLAGLPWIVQRNRADGGYDELPDHDVSWILDKQANPETPAFQFRETILAHCLTWGNGYAEIERDPVGRPVWLWQLTPDRVTPTRQNGRLVYVVRNPAPDPDTILEAEDMFHLRGLGYDGLVGYSVIRMFARTIGAGIAVDEATASFFANDSTPGGFLKHPARLTEMARQNLRETWQKRHGGPSNRRTVAILEENMDWKQTGLPPEDAQLVQQRQLTPTEICRIFRTPPHKIADLSRSTFSNIEHQSIEFVNDTLRPWAERQESEANIKLFGRTNRGQLETVINLDELKRGDTAAQGAFVNLMLGWGVFSINDGRKFLNKNPIGPDGDKRFVPLNYQLLEKAGEEPPPPKPAPKVPAPQEPDDNPPEPKPVMSVRLAAVCLPVLEEACQRVLRRLKSADKELPGQRQYALNVLTGPARVIAEIHTSRSDEVALSAINLLLDRHYSAQNGHTSPQDAAGLAQNLINFIKAAAGVSHD